ncbi:MAG TPA: SGNH/GDSL hydrolase family protein [Verrucomicrobiae bacterium]
MNISAARLLLFGFLLIQSSVAFAAEPRTVIVFGDSITHGSALPKEQQGQIWMALIQKQTEGKLKLVNEGKGGRPTNSVKEFEAMLLKHKQADQLVISLGTNDSRDITDQCVPKAVTNITAMITKARAAYGEKLPILLVGPPNINKAALGPTKPIANEREGKLKELGAAFEKLAKEKNCDYVSLFGVVPDTSLLKDGVHPDVAGNVPIAETILPKLVAVKK